MTSAAIVIAHAMNYQSLQWHVVGSQNSEVSSKLSVVSWIVMEASLICDVLLVTDKIVRLKTSYSEYAQVFIDP